MPKRILLLTLMAVVAVTSFWFGAGNRSQMPEHVKQNIAKAAEAGVTVGKEAPQFNLTDLEGKNDRCWRAALF